MTAHYCTECTGYMAKYVHNKSWHNGNSSVHSETPDITSTVAIQMFKHFAPSMVINASSTSVNSVAHQSS